MVGEIGFPLSPGGYRRKEKPMKNTYLAGIAVLVIAAISILVAKCQTGPPVAVPIVPTVR